MQDKDSSSLSKEMFPLNGIAAPNSPFFRWRIASVLEAFFSKSADEIPWILDFGESKKDLNLRQAKLVCEAKKYIYIFCKSIPVLVSPNVPI